MADFYSFWVTIELCGLIFFGFLLSLSVGVQVNSLIVYFLFQAVASMGLLISFLSQDILGASFLYPFLLFFLLKLGVAPLNFQYFYSLINLPPLGFFFCLTIQKVPIIVMLGVLPPYSSLFYTLFTFLLLSTFVSFLLSLGQGSILYLIITSRIFNSSWLVASFYSSLELFLCYLLTYRGLLWWLIFCSPHSSLVLWGLIGLPPFPLFFVKLLVLYYLLSSHSHFWILIFLFLASFLRVGLLVLYFSQIPQRAFKIVCLGA